MTEFEDLAQSLQRYADEMDLDPERLAQMEERVSLFETLKRKYGGSIPEVIAFGEQGGGTAAQASNRAAKNSRGWKRKSKPHARRCNDAGAKLGAKRSAGAPKLAAASPGICATSGSRNPNFSVALTAAEKPAPHGLESACFLFAPNPGEPPKPLKAIASSGEISRVMLAVKSALAAQDTIGAARLRRNRRQRRRRDRACRGGENAIAGPGAPGAVHQPSPASGRPGRRAIRRHQGIHEGRTISQLREVAGDARVEEIARMLGGKTDSALAHARTLLGARRGA